jgi:CheY-like chemotaxis protein
MAAKILIVDDNPDQREFLEVFLRLQGYSIHTAEDGGAGLEQAVSDPPDLIICDLRMPEVDGVTMVRRLREMPEYRRTQILVLSGDGSGDLRVAVTAGANLALRKPLDLDVLTQTIKEMIT